LKDRIANIIVRIFEIPYFGAALVVGITVFFVLRGELDWLEELEH
jgi:hypothetical protein